MSGPVIAGWGVLLALLALLAAVTSVWLVLTALCGAFVIVWATGAVVYGEWWPIRHLFG